MLMTLPDVARELEKVFADAPFDASEFMLGKPGLAGDDFDEIESELGVEFSPIFRTILSSYRLGGVAFGSVRFGRYDYTDYLLEENDGSAEIVWWEGDERPQSLLLIGSSDGHALLINLSTDMVLALRHGESRDRTMVVARDFELFLRGVATVFFGRKNGNPSLATEVAEFVQADSSQFWSELAHGVI